MAEPDVHFGVMLFVRRSDILLNSHGWAFALAVAVAPLVPVQVPSRRSASGPCAKVVAKVVAKIRADFIIVLSYSTAFIYCQKLDLLDIVRSPKKQVYKLSWTF